MPAAPAHSVRSRCLGSEAAPRGSPGAAFAVHRKEAHHEKLPTSQETRAPKWPSAPGNGRLSQPEPLHKEADVFPQGPGRACPAVILAHLLTPSSSLSLLFLPLRAAAPASLRFLVTQCDFSSFMAAVCQNFVTVKIRGDNHLGSRSPKKQQPAYN